MNTHNALTASKEMHILDVTFNQDQGCFSVAHERGFLVFNTNPVDLRVKRQFNPSSGGSGIGHICMLHRTNYLALVGGGKSPKFPNNKVIIWDDLKRKSSLSLSFMSPVLNVLLSRIRIVVVLVNQVLVYEFSAPPKKFATYETSDNEHGLADLSVHAAKGNLSLLNSDLEPKYQILAFPGRTIGQIQLVDVSPEGHERKSVSIVKAHKTRIRCISLNRIGTMVASASETGTIIRIHSTHTTALLYEFRRGLDRAIITLMEFSPDNSKLAVLLDKNTLHVFNIAEQVSDLKDMPANRQHILQRMVLPIPIPKYFKSTWSFCLVNTNQYHTDLDGTPENSHDIGVIGWSGNDSVVLVWKQKKIWERYVIVDSCDQGTHHYEIVRYSWKNLELD